MKRTLIQSATIITMDDRIGDVRDGDVLVENGRIPRCVRASSLAAARRKPRL
ncbi:hypothetical protein SAMN05216330_102116 [Bradyrhizobium sp. Ghvi]|uniref:hypothetical protein n=1 Tax=Bradyrhizobium sp. Ghvi TaxID=1855319 RepID=UPI0008DF19D8|nr:hypothetical protein [Bradyrhizobium sp. Ghvi]SFO18266.1 hypothetical protein SAMN05216330_102116 [Bradyrhizobium sp. Ghvi]